MAKKVLKHNYGKNTVQDPKARPKSKVDKKHKKSFADQVKRTNLSMALTKTEPNYSKIDKTKIYEDANAINQRLTNLREQIQNLREDMAKQQVELNNLLKEEGQLTDQLSNVSSSSDNLQQPDQQTATQVPSNVPSHNAMPGQYQPQNYTT